MKLVFDFAGATKGKALGIAKHNARIDGHWESNIKEEGKIGGVDQTLSKNNIELKPIQSFSDEDIIKGRKIIGGRQKKAVEFTTWMIQAGGTNDTLPLEENIVFLKESHSWLENEFGKENILSSHIHLDEATPQLQVVMSNIVEAEDNKIYFSEKRMFNYQGLTNTEIRLKAKELQNRFWSEVANKYEIEAPNKVLGTKGKVSLVEWKLAQINEEVKRETLTLEEKRKLSLSNAKLRGENKDLENKLSLQDKVIKKYGINLDKEKRMINKNKLVK